MNSRGPFTHSIGKTTFLIGMLFILLISLLVSVFPPPVSHADDAGDHGDPDFDRGSIVVHLEPDADNASITATRRSMELAGGGSVPVERVYSDFDRDGDAYVFNGVELGDCGNRGLYNERFFEFDITATADGVEYEGGSVTVTCNEIAEATLEGLDDSVAGTLTLALSYRNCADGDALTAFPSSARVIIVGQGDAEYTYREDGNRGLFIFRDLEHGTFRYEATYLDPEGRYVYEVLGNATIGDFGVRINKTATGEPISMTSDETPACQFGSDPDEPPPIDEEEASTCETELDFMGAWLACLFLQIVDDFTNEAIEAVNSMLAIEESEVNDDSLKQAWSYFRNIASLLLVIIGLVMIIGQAISKE